MVRYLREVSFRGTAVATAVGRLLFAVIAVLIVTVGTVTAGSRLPTVGRCSASWHTAKIVRMTQKGGDEAETLQVETVCSCPREVTAQPKPYPAGPSLPTLTGAFPQDALRAPPRA